MSKYDLLPCADERHVSNKECQYAHARLAIEEKMVRGLIRGLKKAGYTPDCVYDGGEYVHGKTETATMDTVFSVDKSTITFEGEGSTQHDSRRFGVLIVLGNGVDCIPDYNVSRNNVDGWNATIERITDELYERYGDC